MPKYATDQKTYPDSIFPPIFPCDVLDANGEVIEGFIRYFDTDTGEVIFAVHEFKDGRWQIVIDHEKGMIVTESKLFKPPLTCIPMIKEDDVNPIIVGPSPTP